MKNLLSVLILFCCTFVTAQVQSPAPSPFAKMDQKVGLTDVSVEYSRPGMKGRTIFGDLIPYGEIWRTGANANTIISFSDDVKVGGKELKKGSYSLYTIPNKESWDVLFYSSTDNWGVPQNWDEAKIAAKISAQVKELPSKVESFTIQFSDLANNSANMELAWSNKKVIVPISVPTESKTMASIEKTMNGPAANDYYAAATYFHDTGKDLEQAHKWITKATEIAGEDAFWMLRRKSLIEADMGKTQMAIASAKRSLASAQKANNADYVKMNKESIEKWEGNK
ncbi:DUF2911 domain-containing protein [Christiangramia salexigens]|uniref:Dihydrolipoamide dehydrogenase n=1 Tax=Christiangramia salexigens TaxID=1913577 RepID=A0A1L3J2T1_9FLAO|nr:DUF2911 domain-containing protein [Christiangramia salexigens]APG59427.1 dihydrolipoamide dehydrogenase [Christiangramia salexigens]